MALQVFIHLSTYKGLTPNWSNFSFEQLVSIIENQNMPKYREKLTEGCPAPVDRPTIQFLSKAQETSSKKEQKYCKIQRTRKSAVRLYLLEMAEKRHSWYLNNMAMHIRLGREKVHRTPLIDKELQTTKEYWEQEK